MIFRAGSATHVGQIRTLNEDSLLVAASMVAVADGMGGHQGGEVASATAIETLAASVGEQTSVEALMQAVQAANRAVLEHSTLSPELRGMGTTLCALAALDEQRVAVVNVGDSRVYLLRGAEYAQISEDHSFVEALVRDGRLTREQADVHPQRNVLTRALGVDPHVDVDGWIVTVETGDRFLLCSDGLFNEVPDEEVATLLRAHDDPQAAADALVDAANAGGGRDNVTCVVLDVLQGPAAAGAVIAAGLVRRSTSADLDETAVDEPHIAPQTAQVAGESALTEASPEMPGGEPAKSERPRRTGVGWRTVAFVLAILLTFGAAFAAVEWYARHTYFVAESDGQIVIYRGPINGVLWIRSERLKSTGVDLASIAEESERNKLKKGVEKGSYADARKYVANLERIAPAVTTTTTSTTTTVATTTTAATPDPAATPTAATPTTAVAAPPSAP